MVFVCFAVNVLRIVAARRVGDVQRCESFKTPFRSVSESSPLESYDIFRDFECWAKSRGARGTATAPGSKEVASNSAVEFPGYSGASQ